MNLVLVSEDTPVTETWSPGMACRVLSPRATTVIERGMLPTGTWSFWTGQRANQFYQVSKQVSRDDILVYGIHFLES